jgi:hypothetical protein
VSVEGVAEGRLLMGVRNLTIKRKDPTDSFVEEAGQEETDASQSG